MGVQTRVNLRHSLGGEVPVEMMLSTFLDVDDQIQHLIGIRELVKEEVQQRLPALESLDEITDSNSSAQFRRSHSRSQQSQGTPARVEQSNLGDHSGAAAASSFDTLSRDPVLMCPDLQPISEEIKIVSLMTLLFSWNLQVPRVSCCEYHVLATEACALLRRLIKQPCMIRDAIDSNRDMFNRQCGECGIMIPRTLARCQLCATVDDLRNDTTCSL
eukprot:TRINITY_DN80325_c0_g1_i1.p1 TRINITY_DN80325_c0_g1~~TRINITY_DN80325_c0_g1_i1.p1  ORF type:complete len:244 (-),score=30.23 TRINITY_DN80325_c0_g1_i1:21-668(-)